MKTKYLLVLLISTLCFAAMTPALAQPTMIDLDPTPPGGGEEEYLPSEQFNVTLRIDAVTDLYLWVVTITWDPNVVEIVTGDPDGLLDIDSMVFYNIYEGDFFEPWPTTWGTVLPVDIDPVSGIIIELVDTLTGPLPGVSGSGDLALFMFRVKDEAEPCTHSTVSIILSDLIDTAGGHIPHTVGPGLFHVIPEVAFTVLGLVAMFTAFGVYGYRRKNH